MAFMACSHGLPSIALKGYLKRISETNIFQIKKNRKVCLNKNGPKLVLNPNKIKKKRGKKKRIFEFGGHLRLLYRQFRVRSRCLILDFRLEVIFYPLPGVAGLFLVVVFALAWDHLDRSVHGTGNLTPRTEIHPEHGRDLSHAVEVPPFSLKGIALLGSDLPFHSSNSGLERLSIEALTLPLVAQAVMLINDLVRELFSIELRRRFFFKKKKVKTLPCP